MVTELCLTCGDIGSKTELVTCFKCVEAAIHKYCMLVMPKKKDSVLWLCEECEETEALRESRRRAHMVLDSDDEIPIKELKKNLTADKTITRKKVKKDQKVDKEMSKEKVKKNQTGDEEISREKPKKDQTGGKKDKKFFREKLKRDQTADKEISRGKRNKAQPGDKKISREKLKKDPTGVEQISREKLKKNQSEDNGVKPEKHEVKPERQQLYSTSTSAEPLIRSIWTGRLNIRNNIESMHTSMCEFSAYLSTKACQDVSNEAARFGPALEIEMVPKSQVWPKHFDETGPTDHSIEVYFFPSLMKYEQVYDYLVFEMVRDDIAMRASLENAALRIFTSVELPLRFRRFQGKLFLWGVFREY